VPVDPAIPEHRETASAAEVRERVRQRTPLEDGSDRRLRRAASRDIL
jgi:hypothetical protein